MRVRFDQMNDTVLRNWVRIQLGLDPIEQTRGFRNTPEQYAFTATRYYVELGDYRQGNRHRRVRGGRG